MCTWACICVTFFSPPLEWVWNSNDPRDRPKKIHIIRMHRWPCPRWALVFLLSSWWLRKGIFILSSSVFQIWISSIGALMGFCSYGPIAIFGVVANECVPTSIAGTAYAIASIFANSKKVTKRDEKRRTRPSPFFRPCPRAIGTVMCCRARTFLDHCARHGTLIPKWQFTNQFRSTVMW